MIRNNGQPFGSGFSSIDAPSSVSIVGRSSPTPRCSPRAVLAGELRDSGQADLAAGKSKDLWINRVGPEAFDYLCRTIWSYGNPPIPCNACSRLIDRYHARLDEPRPAES
jgi:hypothetical protein